MENEPIGRKLIEEVASLPGDRDYRGVHEFIQMERDVRSGDLEQSDVNALIASKLGKEALTGIAPDVYWQNDNKYITEMSIVELMQLKEDAMGTPEQHAVWTRVFLEVNRRRVEDGE